MDRRPSLHALFERLVGCNLPSFQFEIELEINQEKDIQSKTKFDFTAGPEVEEAKEYICLVSPSKLLGFSDSIDSTNVWLTYVS